MPTITISHYQFTLSYPYSEGHRLNAAEAQALNVLRSENIRKVISKRLALLAVGPDGLISPNDLATIQSSLNSLDRSYTFRTTLREEKPSLLEQERIAVKTEHPHLRTTQVELEARRRIAARLKAINPSDLGL